MDTEIKAIYSIQIEWRRIVANWINKDELIILKTTNTLDLQKIILGWLTSSSLKIPSSQGMITPFEHRINSLFAEIREFWLNQNNSLREAINKLGLYSLELPIHALHSKGDGAIRKLGIYFDTVHITDPIHLTEKELLQITDKSLYRFTQKTAIIQNLAMVLQLDELISENVDEPLFLVIPDYSIGNPSRDIHLAKEYIFENIIGSQNGYSSFDDFFDASVRGNILLNTGLLTNTKYRILLDFFGFDPNGETMIAQDDGKGIRISHLSAHSTEIRTIHWFFTKLYESFDIYSRSIQNALSFGIDPVVPIEFWEPYEYLCMNTAPEKSVFTSSHAEEMGIGQGLLSDEMNFLEAISLADLRIIREEGEFYELRKNLRLDRTVIKGATPKSITSLGREFNIKLISKIKEFEQEEQSRRDKSRKAKILSFLSLTGSVALTVLPFVFPTNIPLSIGSSSAGIIIGGNSIRDVVNTIKREKEENKNAVCSPLGIMLNAKNSYGKK
jgi:hypothetical protein